jgi:acetoin utilization deacetylase AcuC-like enzyme
MWGSLWNGVAIYPADFYADPIGLEHDAGPEHPERPERLTALRGLLADTSCANLLREAGPADPASDDEILAVHTPDHLSIVKRAVAAGGGWLDADTHCGPRSLDAALAAAGQALEAARLACGSGRSAFVACRPPGHHATPSRPMGFCLLNNVAIAAKNVLEEGLTDKVVIVDWDVHHGNGTQECFESDGRVFYLSVHQSPLYPYSGDAADTGRGAGQGMMANLPVAGGTRGDVLRSAVANIAVPAIEALRPKVVLVSAGYDADSRDPLAFLTYTSADFRWAAARLSQSAAMSGGGLVCCLEGGYDLAALVDGVVATLQGMRSPHEEKAPLLPPVEDTLRRCFLGHP